VNNPLGNYGPIAATITCVGVVAAFVIGSLFRGALGLALEDVQNLRELALLGLGGILGTVGGVAANRQEVTAANRRLDALGAPPASALPPNGQPNGH
jgi:hypothetical protein